MLKLFGLCAALTLVAVPVAEALDEPVTLSIEKSNLRGSHANGAKVYAESHVDFAVCFRPALEDDTNLTGEFIAENIKLEPGIGRLLIGEFTATSLNEGWSIGVTGKLNTDCL